MLIYLYKVILQCFGSECIKSIRIKLDSSQKRTVERENSLSIGYILYGTSFKAIAYITLTYLHMGLSFRGLNGSSVN